MFSEEREKVMGFLKFLFTGKATDTFKPDFAKSEYDNWMDYLDKGGTTEQWKILMKENRWNFPKDEVDKHLEYEKELRPVFNKYSELLELIKRQWSDLYKSKDYNSKLALKIEKECYEAISYFEQVQNVDRRHNQPTMNESPVYTKLAILYERRGDYEKGIDVCKMAIRIGMSEDGRMEKLIKKAGRTPTDAEMELINNENK